MEKILAIFQWFRQKTHNQKNMGLNPCAINFIKKKKKQPKEALQKNFKNETETDNQNKTENKENPFQILQPEVIKNQNKRLKLKKNLF